MTNMRNVKLILWDFDNTLCYGSPSVNLTNILIGASVYNVGSIFRDVFFFCFLKAYTAYILCNLQRSNFNMHKTYF